MFGEAFVLPVALVVILVTALDFFISMLKGMVSHV